MIFITSSGRLCHLTTACRLLTYYNEKLTKKNRKVPRRDI